MAARFREHPQGLAQALRSPEMQAVCGRAAAKAGAYAEHISAIDTGRYRFGRILVDTRVRTGASGRLRRRRRFVNLKEGQGGGFHVYVGVRRGKAFARLINTTPYAFYLEFGTRYMRRKRTLGKAAAALKFP